MNPPAVDPAGAPDTHEQEQDDLRKERPLDRITIAEIQRCDDIGDLEEGNLHAFGKALIEVEDIKGNQGSGKKDNPEITPKLFITKAGLKLANSR